MRNEEERGGTGRGPNDPGGIRPGGGGGGRGGAGRSRRHLEKPGLRKVVWGGGKVEGGGASFFFDMREPECSKINTS